MNIYNKTTDINLSSSELSELIGDIYNTPLTGKWAEVLDKIIAVTQSNKAFFFLQEVEPIKPLILEFQINFDYSRQALQEFQIRHEEDPFKVATALAPEGEFIDCNEIVDISLIEDTEYYLNVLKPMNTHYVLAGILCRDGIHESAFIVNRSKEQLPYSTEDKNLIKLLIPHLSRAVQIFKTLELYKNYANISKSILDQSDKAIVVCDENAKVILSNSFANSKLADIEQVYFANDILKLSNAVYNKQLHQYIKHCSSLSFNQISSQETIIIDDFIDGENILLTVSPLNNHNKMNNIDVPCCMVTISFQKVLNWSLVEREFSLTNKELQLLKAIYSKKKLNELTSVFEVTYNTLRTHLQAIFKKTFVNSQTELMMKLNMFKS